MNSNTGTAQTYEAGDQRTWKAENLDSERFEVGKANAHSELDPKDQRSLSNRLAAAEKIAAKEDNQTDSGRSDPRAPALAHGNKPSRGAEIDAEIRNDEEEYLKNKGKI